jgi:hypothetical protein
MVRPYAKSATRKLKIMGKTYKDELTFNEELHKYYVNGVEIPCVTRILQEGNFVDFSNIRESTLEASRKFGQAVHKATEYFDLGTLDIDILDPNLLPYLEGWKKFIKDYGLSFGSQEIEQHLYSKIWHFAGTPDRFHEGLLIDLKSGLMYPSAELQTAGYQVLVEENIGKIKQRLGVQLVPGDYKVSEYKNISDRSVFLGAVSGYQWKKNHNCLRE